MTLRARGAAVALGAVVLAVAGCGGDAAGEPPPSSTTTTQPPAGDVDAVRPIVEDLLARYDELIVQLATDPSRASRPDDPVVAAVEELLTPAEFERTMAATKQKAAEGTRLAPLGEERMRDGFLWGELVAEGDDRVQALVCTTWHIVELTEGRGRVKDGISHPGRVYAQRLDGRWRIALMQEDDTQVCDPTQELPEGVR